MTKQSVVNPRTVGGAALWTHQRERPPPPPPPPPLLHAGIHFPPFLCPSSSSRCFTLILSARLTARALSGGILQSSARSLISDACLNTNVIHIYLYMCVCVCVCVWRLTSYSPPPCALTFMAYSFFPYYSMTWLEIAVAPHSVSIYSASARTVSCISIRVEKSSRLLFWRLLPSQGAVHEEKC